MMKLKRELAKGNTLIIYIEYQPHKIKTTMVTIAMDNNSTLESVEKK